MSAGKQYISDIRFHDVDYCISVFVSPVQELYIHLEQISTSQFWSAGFTHENIDQISARAGTALPFPRFIDMLLSGLSHTTRAVTVDLLTMADAQRLQQERGADEGRPARALDSGRLANTRVLTIQYAAEFHRVTFPLPLQYQERPDAAFLVATVRRLRAQVAELRAETGRDPATASTSADEGAVIAARAAAKNAQAQLQQTNARVAELEHERTELKARLARALRRAETAESTLEALGARGRPQRTPSRGQPRPRVTRTPSPAPSERSVRSTTSSRASTPTRRAATPTRRTSTPTRRVETPTRRTSTPTRRAATPTRRDATPPRRAPTPPRTSTRRPAPAPAPRPRPRAPPPPPPAPEPVYVSHRRSPTPPRDYEDSRDVSRSVSRDGGHSSHRRHRRDYLAEKSNEIAALVENLDRFEATLASFYQ